MKPFTYKEYLKYQKKTLNLSDIKEEYIYITQKKKIK